MQLQKMLERLQEIGVALPAPWSTLRKYRGFGEKAREVLAAAGYIAPEPPRPALRSTRKRSGSR